MSGCHQYVRLQRVLKKLRVFVSVGTIDGRKTGEPTRERLWGEHSGFVDVEKPYLSRFSLSANAARLSLALFKPQSTRQDISLHMVTTSALCLTIIDHLNWKFRAYILACAHKS